MANEQISVSRETLRAELGELQLGFTTALGQLELRLLDRLADKAVVEALTIRLTQLEQMALVQGGPVTEGVHNLDKRVAAMEARNPERIIQEFRTAQDCINDLKAWRNRIAGGLLVVGSVATINLLRLWFGVG